MKIEHKKIIAVGVILAFALIVQIGAIALINPFLEEG